MSRTWYLLKRPHDQLSGFEDDAFDDFAQESFQEILDSDVAVDIEYCNPDLSVCIPMRAVVQKNVQDTKLQSMNRELLTKIGTVKAGNYIKYKNRYWLIVGITDHNDMYEKSILTICNYELHWRNSKNEVISRWCNLQSASQYNNGETAHRFYTLRTDQLLVNLPYDDECLLLDSGIRVIIDKRTEVYEKSYDENTKVETNVPLITYVITRTNNTSYNYIDSGHQQILVTQDEQHKGDGYYLIDGIGYWLCGDSRISIDKPNSNIDIASDSKAKIIYESDIIYAGLSSADFTAIYYDDDGNVLDKRPDWIIDCDFTDKLQIDYIDNTMIVMVNDESFINKSFNISLKDYEETKVTVRIMALS